VDVVTGLCFPCREELEFQLYGQTAQYNEERLQKQYIEEYKSGGIPVVECQLCDRHVKYRFEESEGKWYEVEIKGGE
jgi:hypothetical protein